MHDDRHLFDELEAQRASDHEFSRPRPLRRADASPRWFSVTAGPAGYRQTLIALKSVDDIP